MCVSPQPNHTPAWHLLQSLKDKFLYFLTKYKIMECKLSWQYFVPWGYSSLSWLKKAIIKKRLENTFTYLTCNEEDWVQHNGWSTRRAYKEYEASPSQGWYTPVHRKCFHCRLYCAMREAALMPKDDAAEVYAALELWGTREQSMGTLYLSPTHIVWFSEWE